MRLIPCVLIALAAVGCSTSHHASSTTSSTTIPSATTTVHPQRLCEGPTATCEYGTITGRYYEDGGALRPPPATVPPPRPIIGAITVTNTESHETYRPRQDALGYFIVEVPAGTYGVMAESPRGDFAAMTDTVTVTGNQTVNADLGINVP
jgi:hypothetical protein